MLTQFAGTMDVMLVFILLPIDFVMFIRTEIEDANDNFTFPMEQIVPNAFSSSLKSESE